MTVKVTSANISGRIESIVNSSVGAIFNHKGFEDKKPQKGTLEIGSHVKTTDGKYIKVDEISDGVNLGDSVIVYHSPTDS